MVTSALLALAALFSDLLAAAMAMLRPAPQLDTTQAVGHQWGSPSLV